MKSVVVLVSLAFVALAVWWMESRFGAQFAMAVVGSLVGSAIVVTGVMLGLAANKSSLAAAADFHRETMKTEQSRIGLDREREKGANERIKIERIYTEALTKHNLIDAKRVDKIAQDRAKLIAKSDANAPTWGVDDDYADYDMEMPQREKLGRMGRAVDAVESMFNHEEDW